MCIRDRDTCEVVDYTQQCELHAWNSIQNQSVFAHLPASLKYSTPVCKTKNPQCDDSTKGFTQGDSLSAHKLMNAVIMKFQCHLCTKTFTQSWASSQHKVINSGIKKYQCYACTKGVTWRDSLSSHKLKHSGIKPFQCDVCTKTFTRSSDLSQHKISHSCLLYTSRCV